MKLVEQLRDEELTDLLLESAEREMQKFFAGAAQSLRTAAERPEWFWHRQRGGVHERIAASQRSWPALTAVWAGAAALLVLAFALLRGTPAPQPVQAQAQTDSDQQLLVGVEQVMQSEVPEALAPSALLASEISAGANTQYHSRQVNKENSNE